MTLPSVETCGAEEAWSKLPATTVSTPLRQVGVGASPPRVGTGGGTEEPELLLLAAPPFPPGFPLEDPPELPELLPVAPAVPGAGGTHEEPAGGSGIGWMAGAPPL